jgi:hypothetical protein
MDFLKKVGSTAESLLDQVDQKTAEISKDVRSGNYAARMVAERLEKRERVKIEEGGLVDSDVAKKIERLQSDLDAAGEVLQRSQQLAAERELKLTAQLERDRLEREQREDELLQRIRALESYERRAAELEAKVNELSDELEVAHGSRDQDTVDLEAQAEQARLAAEQARAALAATMKESEARIEALEKTNIALVQELMGLKAGREASDGPQSSTSPMALAEEERRRFLRELQELEDRLVAAEDKRASLELQLGSERARAERMEGELIKSGTAIMQVKEEHARSVIALETKIALLKGEGDELRGEIENLKRASLDNGRDALEKRLESLSHHLEMKQRQIDSLRSEKLALEQRVNESVSMPTLRARLPGLNANNNGELKGRFARLKIDPGRHKNVARALDVLDGLTLSAGAIMRAEPLVRLGFLGYILLLHLWVFHIISWAPAAARPPSSSEMPSAGGGNLRGGMN